MLTSSAEGGTGLRAPLRRFRPRWRGIDPARAFAVGHGSRSERSSDGLSKLAYSTLSRSKSREDKPPKRSHGGGERQIRR